jgi:hypothetical protein
MSTDRELLELAAKAAGLDDYVWQAGYGMVAYAGGSCAWNPLTDDGDALRLAVKLRINVEPWGSGAAAITYVRSRATVAEPHYGDDPERATRRAIVRAAAEIGKAMP